MAKLTDVYCTYTGGNIYVCTAKFGDVYLATDFDMYGTYDIPYDDINEDNGYDYEGHWKTSADPLPTWQELLDAVRKSYKDGISTNVDICELETSVRHMHPNMNRRLDEADTEPMDNIKTYAVGNGEITLTAQDAEELRIILQTEYIEHVINEIIDADPSVYRFTSKKRRSRFVNHITERSSDLRDIEGCYAEILEDAMLEHADEIGIRG